MSAPLQILRLLADREPWTPDQLAEATGLERWQVENALRTLRTESSMQSLPKPYQITANGLANLARREDRAARSGEGGFTAEGVRSMVDRAIRRQPPLQSSWRAGQ